ncbi:MAG: hypothetical protein IKI41_08350 [Clostridia bacterium]|nr:hypothetical protein [Clostridia bacterium]
MAADKTIPEEIENMTGLEESLRLMNSLLEYEKARILNGEYDIVTDWNWLDFESEMTFGKSARAYLDSVLGDPRDEELLAAVVNEFLMSNSCFMPRDFYEEYVLPSGTQMLRLDKTVRETAGYVSGLRRQDLDADEACADKAAYLLTELAEKRFEVSRETLEKLPEAAENAHGLGLENACESLIALMSEVAEGRQLLIERITANGLDDDFEKTALSELANRGRGDNSVYVFLRTLAKGVSDTDALEYILDCVSDFGDGRAISFLNYVMHLWSGFGDAAIEHEEDPSHYYRIAGKCQTVIAELRGEM